MKSKMYKIRVSIYLSYLIIEYINSKVNGCELQKLEKHESVILFKPIVEVNETSMTYLCTF